MPNGCTSRAASSSSYRDHGPIGGRGKMGRSKLWSVFGSAVLQLSVLVVGVPSVGAVGTVDPCGPGEVWLQPSAVSQLPDGGQIDTYANGRVTYQVPVPPRGFSPTTASATDLATYGFPERPDGSGQLAAWNDDLATWRWTADTGLCETNARATTDPNTNRAGYRAD